MTIIVAENIGKRYRLPEKHQEKYETFRNMLTRNMQHAWRRMIGKEQGRVSEDFWALRNLSFNIKTGERVGIIGRNGAGKSTLLKMLSRITEPTEGRITLKGRVGSLLEVGTGFHPELTGRENVYLNGAILGMTQREIRRKFDEIVSFAEIEKFLDMPVKRYSSGMYVRLAFAVAAHLEPEILVIDEVLAVGDVQFQKKCLGKMEDIAGHGRTILFVSHNMNAIQQLCNRVLWLEQGKLIKDTRDISGIAQQYLYGREEDQTPFIRFAETRHSEILRIHSVTIGDEAGVPIQKPSMSTDSLFVHIEADIIEPQPDLKIGYALYAENKQLLYWSYATDDRPDRWPSLGKGKCVLSAQIPPHLLNEGLYWVEIVAGLHEKMWIYAPNELPLATFRVLGYVSESPHWTGRRDGLLAPVLTWKRKEA